MIEKGNVLFFMLVCSLFLLFSALVQPISSISENGNISFEPNVIPELTITEMADKSFHFKWYHNYFDLKLYINSEIPLDSFVSTSKCAVKSITKRETSQIEFGYNITNIANPETVDHLLWKIEGASFDIEKDIELEEIEVFEEGYNITRLHLPGNLVLSYEDLWLYDFKVLHPSTTETIVKGVHGKTEWNLDPIVFSGGVITITDYDTEGGACDHNDIYNAMQNSTFQKTENQYYSNARIVIGDGENTTWFMDSGVQVSFNSSCVTANYQNLYEVKASSHLRLGELADPYSKTGKNGVSIRDENSVYTVYLIYASTSAYCELYGSHFYTARISTYIFLSGTNHKVYECVFDRSNPYLMNVDVHGIDTKANSYGLYRPFGTNYDSINMHHSVYGIYFYMGDLGNIQNVEAENNTNFITCRLITENHNVINAVTDSWSFFWSGESTAEIYRQYTFDLTVTFPNGTGIQNANVTVKHYGQGESQDFTELTDSNGQITQKTLTMGFYNQTGGDVQYSFNPYHIEVTNVTGYNDYVGNFTLAEKTEWNICLCPQPYNWFGPTLIMGLIGCFVFVLALVTKK